MADKLFNHRWKVVVDTLDLVALDVRFHVMKDEKPTPNKLEMEIFNLSRDHIAQISKRAKEKRSTGLRVDLSAGYVGNVPLIFTGDAREVHTEDINNDTVTKIAAHDGGRAWRESRMSLSFAPGASVERVISVCATAMDIGIGNAASASIGAAARVLGKTFPHGIVLSGKASDQLTRVTKAAGLSWSVQNGILQLLAQGKPLETSAVRIASDTGMIGSPSVSMDANISSSKPTKKKPTLINVKTLMIPGLYPGRKVVLDADDVKGGYQITQADYVGDTAGNDWNVDLKLRAY